MERLSLDSSNRVRRGGTLFRLGSRFSNEGLDGIWYQRLLDPKGYLRPTAREVISGPAEVLKMSPSSLAKHLAAARPPPDEYGCRDLIGHIFTLCYEITQGKKNWKTAQVLAEHALSLKPETGLTDLTANLLRYALHARDLRRAQQVAEKYKYLGKFTNTFFYDAACAFALGRRPEEAIESLRLAKASQYPEFPSMRRHRDLRSLLGQPEFELLFSSDRAQS